MVNFVLSFCRITAASKIFSRNFYLPLLKPLTPREAFRTFRITGKWLLGSKIQRYIPVLLNHKKKRSKNLRNYGKLKHEEMSNYTYMTPILDPDNETQRILLNILEKKNGSGVFVYTVEDKKLNIVLQAQLEYAVRDGDVIDILVSQKTDKVIIKLKDFKKIPMELDYYDADQSMFCGEGATSEADEKLHHYGKYTMSLAKIFEDKEKQEEEWEIMLKKIIKRRKRHAAEKRKEFKILVKENLKKLDWDQFEEDAKKVVEEINEPDQENPIDMEIDNLEKTLNVNQFFSQSDDFMKKLPMMNEISDVLKNMGNAHFHELLYERKDNEKEDGCNTKKISGVRLILSSGKELFISGQMVHTEDGEVFVPGQTVHTEQGLEFVPGFTVNIDGKPSLINGLIMAQNENDPMFLPTQSAITADGQLTFALTEEERPPPPTAEYKKMRKERRAKLEQMSSEHESTESNSEKQVNGDQIQNEFLEGIEETKEEEEEEAIILLINEKDLMEADASDTDSGESEDDAEIMKMKQERNRAELEELKKILLEDGMEKLVSDLEDKKLSLQQRLDELRKLTMESERPLITYATERDAIEIASKITQDQETINRIVDIILTMLRKTSAIRDKNSIHPENIVETHVILNDDGIIDVKYHKSSKNLKILLKSVLVAANKVFKERPRDQLLALDTIGQILLDILKNNEPFLTELTDLMSTASERNEICDILLKYLTYDYRDSKVNILSQIINCPRKSVATILEGVEKLMSNYNKVMCDAFLKLSKKDEDILDNMLEYCRKHSRKIKIENDVMSLLEEGMISASNNFLDENFDEIISYSEEELKGFSEEAVSFAKALGQLDIANILSEIDLTKIDELGSREKKFLKRIFLMRKLMSKEYTMKNGIERLRRNPDQAKFDPRIRQLIRESGVLLSSGCTIKNSKTIPLQLLKSENLLGLEDFIIQRMKVDYPVLIIRNDLQAIIPREALQGVQSGRMPYVLIDESGISNFKPLHTLAAMKGSKSDHVINNKYSKFNGDIDFRKERRQSNLSRTSMNFA